MPSLLPGYEYDIFISYRQNDNRSGWVTDFVKSLREELAGTLKDTVSIYFDQNPHDGLLETHEVDESLKEKLQCLIFIPIISQTYCDPKSFAWKHEFLAFRNTASNDKFGLKIKLGNGNVASRILPVRIHDLDERDRATIEKEIGPLRGIEFIHHSPGVNRPLNAKDDEVRTAGQILYKNQVNKTANGIKEIIAGLTLPSSPQSDNKSHNKSPSSTSENSKARRKISIAVSLLLLVVIYFGYQKFKGSGHNLSQLDKSIAVLPLVNLSDDQKDYFSDGLTDDIIDKLAKIRGLRVISRTSVMGYKGTTKKIPEIARELGVSYILEGTVRREGDQLKVTTQLIKGESDFHIWSETIEKKSEEVFQLQAEIAMQIARYLEITLSTRENNYLEQAPTSSIAAYDDFLQARELTYTRRAEDLSKAISLLKDAIKLDPDFVDAIAQLSITHSWHYTERGYMDSAKHHAYQSLAMAPNRVMPNLAMGYIVWWADQDEDKALSYFRKVNRLDPSQGNRQLAFLHLNYFSNADSAVYYFDKHLQYVPHESLALVGKGMLYLNLGLPDSAKKYLDEARLFNPKEPGLFFGYSTYLICTKKYDSLIAWANKKVHSEIDRSASSWSGAFGHAFKSEYAKSIEWNIQSEEPDTLLLAYCKMGLGENGTAERLLDEYIKARKYSTSSDALPGLAAAYLLKKDEGKGYSVLEGLDVTKEYVYINLMTYPFMVQLRSTPKFKKAVGEKYEKWRTEMIANIERMYGR